MKRSLLFRLTPPIAAPSVARAGRWCWLALLAPVLCSGADSPGFAAFKIIGDRNIFSPRRIASVSETPRATRRAPRVDTLTLVGTMEYDEGPVAFFDGSSSQYRKAVRPGESIAGFQLSWVRPASVVLSLGTNHFEVAMGGQLRREEDSEWRLAATPELPALAHSNRAGPGAGPGPAILQPAPPAPGGANASPQVVILDPEGEELAGFPSEMTPTNGLPEANAGETDPVLLRLRQRAAAERGDRE